MRVGVSTRAAIAGENTHLSTEDMKRDGLPQKNKQKKECSLSIKLKDVLLNVRTSTLNYRHKLCRQAFY